MSAVVIRVDGLGKQYKIGGPAEPYGSLRESLARAVTNPFRRLRRSSTEAEDTTLWALRDVSFEVKHGEVVGIIGRNGAGKSTLLKVLSRITEPTRGRIDLYGRVGALLEVGTGFHPELTGRENIMLNGTILGMSRHDVRARFDEIVAFAEVERFIDTPVKRYSSGMYLRLAFAVAAHLEPEILVVDEVLAVGDAQFQKKCLGKMREVAGEGRTVLFVSHNMSAISFLCQYGLLLQQGCVAVHGPVAPTVAAYMSQGTDSSGSVALGSHPANKSDLIQFEEISVYQDGSGPLGAVMADTDIEVRLVYRVLRPIQGIEISLAVELADGQYLFSTTDVDITADLDRRRIAGCYSASCVLPAAFFRSGRYYLTCGSSRPNVEQLTLMRQILGFDVLDPQGVETQTGQRRVGVISPRLVWHTEAALRGLALVSDVGTRAREPQQHGG